MKKNVKKITSTLLTLLLLLSIIPLNGLIQVEAATTDSGKVSDTINWSYNDGTLTISGSGEMPNYKTVNYYYEGIVSDAPWGDYLNNIKTVIISGSVLNIGDCCFSDCPSLSNVTLGSSIEKIGTSAFARCVNLSRINLPDSLIEINGSAFIGCTRLDEVLIPDSVTFIGSSAFQSCSSLSKIKLSSNLKKICSDSFYLCKNLASIDIPNSVTEIGGDAFRECNKIQDVVIPQSVSYIWVTAFFNCSSLKKATIYNNSIGFGKNVFSGCNIDFKIYGYLNSTSQSYATENGYTFVALDGSGTEILPTTPEVTDSQDIQNILSAVSFIRTKMKNRESTVEGTVSLTASTTDTAMKEIEKQIFAYTSDAQEGDYLKENCISYSNSFSTSTVSGKRVLKYKYSFEYKTTHEQEQIVSQNVSQIISNLSLSGLTDYGKTEKIYNYIIKNVSYDYQHYLDSSYIPQFTAYAALVDKKAVCEGYSLLFYRIAVEAGVTCRIVSGKVGNGDHAWNLIKIGDLYYCIDSTFASTANDGNSYFLKGSITFKDHILNGEFTSEQYKKEVPISDFDYVDNSNVKTVGSGALNASINWKVNEIVRNNGVNQYSLILTGSGTTPNYSSNSSLPWNNWKNIINTVVVESSVSSIGNYTFANMSNLESAQIASSVVSLGDYVFYNCPKLSNVQITESTQSFGKCAIGGKYGDTIWEYIPTQNKLIISGYGKMGEPYKNADTQEMTSEKVPWNRLASTITDVEIKSGVQNISSFAFCGFSSLITVSMPSSISAIETSAFENCKSLTYISLPKSVSEIGHYAFRYCEGLRNIHIPSNVRKIGVNVFYNCPYLHELYFYGNAPSFDNNAIYNNEVITVFYNKSSSGWNAVKAKYDKVKFESWTPDEYDDSGNNTGEHGIKYATSGKYGENVYWSFDEKTGALSITGSGPLQEPITISSTDADGTINILYHTGAVAWNPFLLKIKSVSIDEGITDLTRYAFFCLQNAKSISIPNSVTRIGNEAFEKCYSLSNLYLGEKTTTVEKEAFLDCNGLQNMYIPSAMKSFGEDAFKNTSLLKDIYYEGTQYQWNSITKGNNSSYLKNVTIHYNCNRPAPDPSTFDFSLSGKKYFILNKEGNLNVSYQSAVDGQVLNELKNIKWTNSNSEVATVSGLDTGIADTGNNKVSVMATVKALNVGTTTIEGTSPDGRKASFTINVEPEIKAISSLSISKTKEIETFTISINNPDDNYLANYVNSLDIQMNNNPVGSFSITNKRIIVEESKKKAKITYTFEPQKIGGSVTVIASSPAGQKATTIINNSISAWDYQNEWNFKNYSVNSISLTDDDYFALIENCSAEDIAAWNRIINKEHGGQCYGMAVSSVLAKKEILSLDDIQNNSNSLYSISRNASSESVIGYYYLLQCTPEIQQYQADFEKMSKKQQISKVLDCNLGVFLFSFKTYNSKESNPNKRVESHGHAIVINGKESGNWTINNITYNIRMLTYDSNYPKNKNSRENSYIYINTQTNEWLIPNYSDQNLDFSKNSSINGVLIDENLLNVSDLSLEREKGKAWIRTKQQGYRIIGPDGLAVDVRGPVVNNPSFSAHMDYSYNPDNNDRTINIELNDYSNYRLLPLDDDYLDFSFSCSDYFLSSESYKCEEIRLSDGKISLFGLEGEHEIELTVDKNNSKYSTYVLSGNNTTDISLEMTDNGLSIEGDDLSDITITGKNQTDDESESISIADGDNSVQIINQNKTFDLSGNMVNGDVNLDGIVSINDATTVQQYLAEFFDLSDIQKKVADTDGDGTITITDATVIQQYLAEYIDHFNQPSAIKLNTNAVTLNVSDTHSLLATISPSDVTNKSVTWTSSDNDIATISNGTVTAKSPGTAKITAKTYNGKTAKCTVTVKQIEPSSVSLNKNTLSLNEGDSYQLSATVSPNNATNKSITWETNNPAIATVNSNGKVKGNASGSATITATTSNGKKASCTITVISTSPTSIAPDHWSYYLTVGETTQILPIIKPDNAKTTVSWNSSDNSIATVNSSGTVTAVSEGTATITLTTDNGLSERCGVIVKKISIGSFYNYIDHDLTVLSKMYKQPQGLIVGQDDSVFIYNYKDRDTKASDPSKFSEFSKSLKILENTYIVRVNQNDYLGFYRTMFENRSLDAKVYNSVVQHQVDAFYDACEASYYYTYFATGDIEFSDFESRYKQCVENQRNHQKSAIIGIVDELYNSTLDINDKEIYHNGDNSVYQGLKSKIENAKTKSDVEALVQYFEKNFSK